VPVSAREPSDLAIDSSTYSPGAGRTIEILEHLAASPTGLTLAELSTQLELPKNAVFRITNTLRERGYLTRDDSTLKFTLTERLLELGQPRPGRRTLAECALGPMRDLRDETKETVQLGKRFGDEGVILEQIESLHALKIGVELGCRFPLYNNAPGKLILAWLPERQRKDLIRRLDLAPCTPRTITDRQELARECLRIREAGYSTDYGEADEGVHCVAAAIFDARGDAVAAVWISAFARRLPKSLFADRAGLVRRAADRITQMIKEG
jgi:DNA-binding IclR family transcriptional regulator